MDSKQYWDNKILEWEDSLSHGKNVSLIEVLAAKFRKPLIVRRERCLELLRRCGKGKTLVELGCGSGFFAFQILKEVQPRSIIAIDISPNAIARANALKDTLGMRKGIAFKVGDANALTLPKADIVVALGFLDYLSADEIQRLFRTMKSRYFLFTFSEKRASLLRVAHLLYLLSQRCPKHYYYTKKEMMSFIDKRFEGVRVITAPAMSFGCIVHNLPLPVDSPAQ